MRLVTIEVVDGPLGTTARPGSVLKGSLPAALKAQVAHRWTESELGGFLARAPKALLHLAEWPELGNQPLVLRRVAEADLFLLRKDAGALALELGTERRKSAVEAVSKLAHDAVVWSRVYPELPIRPVVCGFWDDTSIARAQQRWAWSYLSRGKLGRIQAPEIYRLAHLQADGRDWLAVAHAEERWAWDELEALPRREPKPERLKKLAAELAAAGRVAKQRSDGSLSVKLKRADGFRTRILADEAKVTVRLLAEAALRERLLKAGMPEVAGSAPLAFLGGCLSGEISPVAGFKIERPSIGSRIEIDFVRSGARQAGTATAGLIEWLEKRLARA